MAKYFHKEESGYSDPFGDGCPNNFDIVQFINDSNNDFSTPIESPADPARFLSHHHPQQQQQLPTSHHPQQLMVHNLQQHPQQLQQNHLQGSAYGAQPAQLYAHAQARAQQGPNTHLPDSPPITDVSAGGSSASPSSGSYSPFSPHHQQHYRQQGAMVANPLMGSDGNLLSMQQRGEQMLADDYRSQMHLQRMLQPQQPAQMSPEFFSPYPPSQSTPGSQASQVSPMSNSTVQQRISYMFASQQPPAAMGQPFGADQLYAGGGGNGRNSGTGSIGSNGSGSLSNGNSASSLELDSISPAGATGGGGGHKRRRTSVNSENIAGSVAAMVKRESMDNNNGAAAVNANGQRAFGRPVQRTAVVQRPLPPSSRASFTSEFDCSDGTSKAIKVCNFFPFFDEHWAPLYDYANQELPALDVTVVADKGFNYSAPDNCFVNQKKNHFQITTNIAKMNCDRPYYVRLPSGELQPVTEFLLAFCGVKSEMPTSEIPVKQSTTERKPIPHEGVRFQIEPSTPTKQTVPRLHFSETTMNNHRKHGKPNPEQKFFHLVVKLMANTPVGAILVQAYQSDRIIVRASNPGQFEQPESEAAWQRGGNGLLHYGGQVAIGTDKPVHDAALTVNGNVVTSGQITRPSDRRVKDDIADLDAKEALERLNQMRIVEYAYKPEIAQQWGLTEENRHRVGVIAQELAEILPDAVRDNGDYLTVDDTRIFYDTVAAAQELHRLTANLEHKIDHVERVSHKLARIAQKRKAQMGSMASGISDFSNLTAYVKEREKDNKSFVSCSSLASCDDQKKRQRRACRPGGAYYCTRADPTLCTSKVTQGTIVALVMVMALCLMAMCTLYVVDWYNRTYVYHVHPLPPPPREPAHHEGHDPNGLGHYVEEIGFSWKPPLDSSAPPLAGHCPAGAACPAFCCQHGSVAAGLLAAGQTSDATVVVKTDSVSSAGASLESGVRIEVMNLNVTLDGRYCTGESCDARLGRYNLYVPVSARLPTIPLTLRITLADEGMYVDNCGYLERFNHRPCALSTQEEAAEAAEKGEKISVGAGAKQEGSFEMPSSYKVSDNVIELSVGTFLQSAYRFRVGHTSQSCGMPEHQQGRSFDEYNLVFYRTCGEGAAAAVESSAPSTPSAPGA